MIITINSDYYYYYNIPEFIDYCAFFSVQESPREHALFLQNLLVTSSYSQQNLQGYRCTRVKVKRVFMRGNMPAEPLYRWIIFSDSSIHSSIYRHFCPIFTNTEALTSKLAHTSQSSMN